METHRKIILKPRWMDKGDEDADFRIVEDNGDRFLVVDNNSPLEIKPTFVVYDYMVEEIVPCV